MGVNVQKLAHSRKAAQVQQQQQQQPQDDSPNPNAGPVGSVYLTPLWIAGFLSVVIGSLCDLVAFSFADMSLLAPLGAITLVINLAMAPFVQGEKLTSRDALATGVILAGTVLCISFGSKGETKATLHDMALLFLRPLFIVYVVIAFVYAGFVGVYMRYYRRRRARGRLTPREIHLHSCVFPTLAGLCGGHSVLFAKACGQIVIVTADGENQFIYWGTYMLFFLLGAFLFLQVKFLNMGLVRANALLVVPVYQVSWVFANATVGMVYWRDFEHMDSLDTALFFVGIAIAVYGVYLLAASDSHHTAVRTMSANGEIPEVQEADEGSGSSGESHSPEVRLAPNGSSSDFSEASMKTYAVLDLHGRPVTPSSPLVMEHRERHMGYSSSLDAVRLVEDPRHLQCLEALPPASEGCVN
jgi:hypothetical protein